MFSLVKEKYTRVSVLNFDKKDRHIRQRKVRDNGVRDIQCHHTKKCVYGKGHLLSCGSVVIFRSGGIVVISVSYEELPNITFCLIQKIVTWL